MSKLWTRFNRSNLEMDAIAVIRLAHMAQLFQSLLVVIAIVLACLELFVEGSVQIAFTQR